MDFAILASGSSGNCMVVSDGETTILIDAGISCKQMTERLGVLGIAPESISAICLTHDHIDHIGGIPVFCKKYKTPIYASMGTREAAAYRLKQEKNFDEAEAEWIEFAPSDDMEIGSLTIKSFAIPHDAGEPVGFTIRGEGRCLGIATDLGYIPVMVEHHLKKCHALILESNHDMEMLMESDRPWHLKDRIKGRHGHLSNEQCAETVAKLLPGILSTLVLAHISAECNTPVLARNVARQILKKFDVLESIALHVATMEATEWMRV